MHTIVHASVIKVRCFYAASTNDAPYYLKAIPINISHIILCIRQPALNDGSYIYVYISITEGILNTCFEISRI